MTHDNNHFFSRIDIGDADAGVIDGNARQRPGAALRRGFRDGVHGLLSAPQAKQCDLCRGCRGRPCQVPLKKKLGLISRN